MAKKPYQREMSGDFQKKQMEDFDDQKEMQMEDSWEERFRELTREVLDISHNEEYQGRSPNQILSDFEDLEGDFRRMSKDFRNNKRLSIEFFKKSLLRYGVRYLNRMAQSYGEFLWWNLKMTGTAGKTDLRERFNRSAQDLKFLLSTGVQEENQEKGSLLLEVKELEQRVTQYETEPALYQFEKMYPRLLEEVEDFSIHILLAQDHLPLTRIGTISSSFEEPSRMEHIRKEYEKLREGLSYIKDLKMKKELELIVIRLGERVMRLEKKEKIPEEIIDLQVLLAIIEDKKEEGEDIRGDVKDGEDRIRELSHLLSASSVWGQTLRTLSERFAFFGGRSLQEDAFCVDRSGNFQEQVTWAFQVLGLGPTATQKDVKHAYRALAQTHHPDRFVEEMSDSDREEAGRKMQRINDANEFLKKFFQIK